MAKLSDIQYSNINTQIQQELPSIDGLIIENTPEGLFISGDDFDDEQLNSILDMLTLDDTLSGCVKDGKICIVSLQESTNENTIKLCNKIFVELYKNKNTKDLSEFKEIAKNFITNGQINENLHTKLVKFAKARNIYEDDNTNQPTTIELDNGNLTVDNANNCICIKWNDGNEYTIKNVNDDLDIDKLVLILNNTDDISSIIDELSEVGYILDINEAKETNFDKDEFYKIIQYHNVSGKKIDKNKISDKTLNMFNEKFKNFIKKYPDFDLFSDDYDGESDDVFVDMLIDVIKNDGIKIV